MGLQLIPKALSAEARTAIESQSGELFKAIFGAYLEVKTGMSDDSARSILRGMARPPTVLYVYLLYGCALPANVVVNGQSVGILEDDKSIGKRKNAFRDFDSMFSGVKGWAEHAVKYASIGHERSLIEKLAVKWLEGECNIDELVQLFEECSRVPGFEWKLSGRAHVLRKSLRGGSIQWVVTVVVLFIVMTEFMLPRLGGEAGISITFARWSASWVIALIAMFLASSIGRQYRVLKIYRLTHLVGFYFIDPRTRPLYYLSVWLPCSLSVWLMPTWPARVVIISATIAAFVYGIFRGDRQMYAAYMEDLLRSGRTFAEADSQVRDSMKTAQEIARINAKIDRGLKS